MKSNVGHLLAAAGVAGAIKAMLAVERGELPPSINFERMNEHISLEGTPFTVNTALAAMPMPAAGPRRAAVSAFGFSGTNATWSSKAMSGRPPPPAGRGRGSSRCRPGRASGWWSCRRDEAA